MQLSYYDYHIKFIISTQDCMLSEMVYAFSWYVLVVILHLYC